MNKYCPWLLYLTRLLDMCWKNCWQHTSPWRWKISNELIDLTVIKIKNNGKNKHSNKSNLPLPPSSNTNTTSKIAFFCTSVAVYSSHRTVGASFRTRKRTGWVDEVFDKSQWRSQKDICCHRLLSTSTPLQTKPSCSSPWSAATASFVKRKEKVSRCGIDFKNTNDIAVGEKLHHGNACWPPPPYREFCIQ